MAGFPQRIVFLVLAVSILAGAFALRSAKLDIRPMHTDEAVQADILRLLKEEGDYIYRPEDYHGPVLVYSTLPFARGPYAEISERTLRIVPALYGTGIVLLTFLFSRWLGNIAVIAAALLTALSPMMSFYSRYYIMEVPMVFFLFAFLYCALRYLENTRKPLWLFLAAACGALMHATKETFVLSIAAMVAGAVALTVFEWRNRKELVPKFPVKHVLVGAAIAILLSAALFSNLFQNPKAVLESYTTYFGYANRAEGSGHEKPWDHYIRLLGFTKMEGRFVWTEAFVLGLALVGIAFGFLARSLPSAKKRFVRFLSVYAVTSLFIYSVIPYKTPWSIMAFLHAAILLAGFGAAALIHVSKKLPIRIAVGIVLLSGCWHLGVQSVRANFPTKKGRLHLYADEDRNPYLYSHTTRRLLTKIVDEVNTLAGLHPDGKAMRINVVHPETAWPLPWYFRDFTRIAWYPAVPAEGSLDVPVLIADEISEEALDARLSDKYVRSWANLREDNILVLYIEQRLFDKLIDSRSQ